jgi:hypothetical protein
MVYLFINKDKLKLVTTKKIIKIFQINRNFFYFKSSLVLIKDFFKK